MILMVSVAASAISVTQTPTQQVSLGDRLSSYVKPIATEILGMIYSSARKYGMKMQKIQGLNPSSTIPPFSSHSLHVESSFIASVVAAYIALRPYQFDVSDLKQMLIENEIVITRQTFHSLFNEGLPDGWLDISLTTINLVQPTIEMNTCADPNNDGNACLRFMVLASIQGHEINVLVNLGFLFINTMRFSRPFVKEFFLTIPEPDKVDAVFNAKGIIDFSKEALSRAINPINAAISYAYQNQLSHIGSAFRSLRINPGETGWGITFDLKLPQTFDVSV